MQTNLVCGDEIIKNTKLGKNCGISLENNLNFATHLLNIIKNANKNFNALMRVQENFIFPPLLNRDLPTVL